MVNRNPQSPDVTARPNLGTPPARAIPGANPITGSPILSGRAVKKNPVPFTPSHTWSAGARVLAPRLASTRPITTTFHRGQQVFTATTGRGQIYIVRTGCIRLYKRLSDGRSINLALLGSGNLFSQEDNFDGLSTGTVAEAVVDSSVSIVEIDQLSSLIADSPELATAVVDGMNRRMTELQTLVEHLLVRDTSMRLATMLLNLASRFGRQNADGSVAIALPITHQSLANMIGSNRVTVTRKLMELQDTGLLRASGRNAIAVFPNRLRTFIQDARDGNSDGLTIAG